jgi:hypothetical protein
MSSELPPTYYFTNITSMPATEVVPPLKIGFGLKKRKAPKRKSMNGCALLPAGY